jgi:hypothetical protein
MTQEKAVKLAFLLTATDQMSKVLEKAGSKMTGFQKKLAETGAKALSTGGHYITMGNQLAGGMLNIVKATADYGDKAYKSAQKVGMEVGDFQKLAYSAEFADIENEQLVSSMVKFNKTITEATRKGTGDAYELLKDWGIKVTDEFGKIRAPDKLMAELADKFSSLEDGVEKTVAATVLWGKSGANMLPLLNDGAQGLKEMGDEAEKNGLIFSKELAKSCQVFNDKMKSLNKSISFFKVQLGTALIPVLNKVVEKLTAIMQWLSGWAKEHQTLAKVIGMAVTGIGSLLFTLGSLFVAYGAIAKVGVGTISVFKKLATFAKLLAKGFVAAKKSMFIFRIQYYSLVATQRISTAATWLWSGAVRAARAVAWFFSSGVIFTGIKLGALAVWQGISTAAMWLWSGAVRAARAVAWFFSSGVIFTGIKLGALAVWQGISTAAMWLWSGAVTIGRAVLTFFSSGVILTGIKLGALAVWQGIVTVAQWLFNTALFSCPITWIVLGIMAVIAAVVLLIKNWDAVAAFFVQLWEGIKNVFTAVWEWVKNLFIKYHPISILIRNWDAIAAWFAGLWDSVKRVFFGAWEGIKSILSSAWGGIKSVLSGAWEGIMAWLSGLPERFVEWGGNLIQGLIDGILGGVGKLLNTLKSVGEGIGKFFTGILGISSPSTVFAQYGLNITQGLVVGIDRGEGAVESATGGLAMQAIRSTGQSIQAGSVRPAQAVGSMGGGGVSLSYAPVINIGSGVSEGTKQDFAAMLRSHYGEIVGMIRRYEEGKERVAF